ncbi:hypothetical protein V6N13_064608 [Hibiscus sabdariffa]|uniref:EF-hand domain-containing protein n=1 Tax=Hibiscus sabdariffa TaxID=183260 RepID=A0ABR2EB10_9ROSI
MMRSEGYERVLRCFDENGDGKISASELSRRLRQMGGEVALGEEDVGIEAMGLEDVMELMEGRGEEEKMKDLREAFEMYDGDGSGFITPTGLNKMLAKLGESKSMDECRVMIKQFDLNSDGLISFEEFRVMMHY